MATHKVFMGAGIVIAIIGLLLLSTVTLYYYDYPSTLDYPRTLGEGAVKVIVLAAGVGIYKWGERMRDAR